MPILTLNVETNLQIFLTMCLITILIVVILTECIFMLLGKMDEKTQKEPKNTVYAKLPKEALTWFPIFLSVLIFFILSSFSKELRPTMPIIFITGLLLGTIATAFYSGGLKRILKLIKHIDLNRRS